MIDTIISIKTTFKRKQGRPLKGKKPMAPQFIARKKELRRLKKEKADHDALYLIEKRQFKHRWSLISRLFLISQIFF
jgi:hypothetical protein